MLESNFPAGLRKVCIDTLAHELSLGLGVQGLLEESQLGNMGWCPAHCEQFQYCADYFSLGPQSPQQ
jgi:hypothetical protein